MWFKLILQLHFYKINNNKGPKKTLGAEILNTGTKKEKILINKAMFWKKITSLYICGLKHN